MEEARWSADYQQSARTGPERSDGCCKPDTTDAALTENGLSRIKEEPDAVHTAPPVQHALDNVISEKSKQTIQLILAQIKSLSLNDKYLLYLKLPSEITDIVDPFRQPLNPLGSRSEICRTIVWIRTHLEEDQNISLPKKEVYNEYEQYCDKNNIKPLSQADFGKVMKQVFPKVRARRLGQRGNSKYCYSGLQRRISLDPPVLPDLSDKPLSTEAPISQSNVATAWLVIKDWAQQQFGGVQFTSLQSLAQYLVRNGFVSGNCDGVAKLTPHLDCQTKIEEGGGKNVSKHREMQLQLQKKIQQRSEGKERKRKAQPSKVEPKPGAKKCRSHSVPATGISLMGQDCLTGTNGGEGSSSAPSSSCGSNSVSPTQGRTICDKPEFTQQTQAQLPDFKSFHKKALVIDTVTSTVLNGVPDSPTVGNIKIALPALQPATESPKDGPALPKPPPQRKAKYKMIQPRLQPCDIATYNASQHALAPTRSQLVQQDEQECSNVNVDNKSVSNLNDCEDDDDFPLTRERLDSVSNVEKDAMDEYLGNNNSQHEEELSKYFTPEPAPTAPNPEETSKISTLRQLLEQNGISEKRPLPLEPVTAIPDPPAFSNPSVLPQSFPVHSFNTLGSARRRVSFETPVADDSVPPSPNTRSKNFNFTPISPSSPNGTQSKCSSTSASPFVSPRNTPVSRLKNNAHQNAGIMLENRTKLGVKVKKELDLSLEIPPVGEVKSYLPMSAPVSPMLSGDANKSVLQKLLNSGSKVHYTPEYATGQPVVQVANNEQQQFFPPDLRSQSVPLNQMQTANFTSLVTNLPDELLKRQNSADFASNDDAAVLNSLEPPCDNNNVVDPYKVDLSRSNQFLMEEYGLTLVNTCQEADYAQYANKVRGTGRSQSIDAGFDVGKRRSVPNTPLPFAQTLSDKSAPYQGCSSSRSYPSTPRNSVDTFVYQANTDCIINDNTDGFVTGFGESVSQIDSNDFIIENGDALMDDNGILMSQEFNGRL